MDIRSTDATNGFRIEVIPRIESENVLNLDVFELKGKVTDDITVISKLLPVSFLDGESEPMAFLGYENLFCLNKKVHVFVGSSNRIFVCRNCLISFDEEFRLRKHQIICLTNDPCILQFPKEDWLSFKRKSLRLLFRLDFILIVCVQPKGPGFLQI